MGRACHMVVGGAHFNQEHLVFFLLGLDRWIAVSGTAPNTPSIGDNLKIICEVAEDSPYNNPKWMGPDNEEVPPVGASKYLIQESQMDGTRQ